MDNEQLNHEEFLREAKILRDEIYRQLNFSTDKINPLAALKEIEVYGDEPAFTSVLHDVLIKDSYDI